MDDVGDDWSAPLADVQSLTGNLFDDVEVRSLWEAVQQTGGWQGVSDAFEYAVGMTRLAQWEAADAFDWNATLREVLRAELRRRVTGM